MTPHTPRTRDAALRRLAKSNRWLIAGSAALTGIFTAVAANAFPGHTLKNGAANSRAHTGAGASEPPLKAPESGAESGSEPGAESPSTESPATPGESGAAPESGTAPEAETTPQEGAAPEAETAPESAPESGAPTGEAQAEPPVVSGGS